MINVEKIKPTGLFTNYIYKAIPLAFDESMSYYETLCGLLAYLKDTVIPALNNNADAIIEVQELMIQLQNYVDNYFDNLDVQEEINTKLDEMAESGVLEEIMADYLDTRAVFGFDTVADMKLATNLTNGSFAQTLGYYNKNDGGEALYKIREITNEDVVDEMFIIALSDVTLIAELIYYNTVNVKQIGAKGDNTQDDTSIIQAALNKNKTVFIPEGNYKITNTLNMGDTYKISGLEPHLSKITLSDKDKDIIKLKDGNTYNIAIHNLGLNHSEIGTGNGIVFGNSGVWQLNSISNCRLTNNNIGIYVKQSTGSLYSSEIKNCEIYNYNVAGIQLLNIGSSGNIYSNLYLHNNNRSSQYGVMIVQEDNFNANNLNIEWGEYTTAPLYLQLSNGFISNLHLEGVNSPVALQFFNRCSVSLENVWLNFVNSSYNIFNVDGANVKIKLNLLKLINNTENNQTVTSVRYTNDTHIQDDNEIIVNTLVTNNNQFTINYTTKKFGSHIIPEMFNNQKQSERVYNRWKAYTNASSNTFKQNDYGNQIEFINGIHVDDKDYLHAICIATGVATDQTISESGLITQYNSTIRYPKSDGQLTSGTSLKIDDNLYITTSNSYSYDTDNYAINLNKNVSSTSGTYTIYKSEAQYKYL